jgi:hypothetical protein
MTPDEWFKSQYVFTGNPKDFVSLKCMVDCYRPYHRTTIKGHLTRKVFFDICETHGAVIFSHFHERKKIDGDDYNSVFLGIRKLDE